MSAADATYPEADDGRLAYDRAEVAEKLGVSPSFVSELIADGRLRSIKLGPSRASKRLIPRSALLEFLGESEPA